MNSQLELTSAHRLSGKCRRLAVGCGHAFAGSLRLRVKCCAVNVRPIVYFSEPKCDSFDFVCFITGDGIEGMRYKVVFQRFCCRIDWCEDTM